MNSLFQESNIYFYFFNMQFSFSEMQYSLLFFNMHYLSQKCNIYFYFFNMHSLFQNAIFTIYMCKITFTYLFSWPARKPSHAFQTLQAEIEREASKDDLREREFYRICLGRSHSEYGAHQSCGDGSLNLTSSRKGRLWEN